LSIATMWTVSRVKGRSIFSARRQHPLLGDDFCGSS
jgi:hypothetical protein